MAKILIAEDHRPTLDLIFDWLESRGHIPECVMDGREALALTQGLNFDLLILDINLPALSGFDVLESYRAGGGLAPVLILTGRNDIVSKKIGFEYGADDFLAKPFEIEELLLRVNALLRRPPLLYVKKIRFGDLEMDLSRRELAIHGVRIALDPQEFTLLEFFLRNPNHVFSVEEILARAWPADAQVSHSALTTCLRRLRHKIDGNREQSMIRSVYGAGYCLDI